jgi:DNA-binding NarL/FixJ family response regulator
MRFHGDWNESGDEVRRAHTLLLGPPVDGAVGEALYQQAELHRLRGEHASAERAYAEASQFGRRPEPGLPLLRLAQGRTDAGWATIRRALDEDPNEPRLLEAAVEIALARGDVDAARTHADRLRAQAQPSAPELLRAMATRADGTVLLAEGDPGRALRALRDAWSLWNDLDAPYETARVRVAIARACRALGDEETAALELDAARHVFERLGAPLDAVTGGDDAGAAPAGLTAREVEVLRLVAGGRTNRDIAHALGISERTVDRHVSNIHAKLDVTSRTAATAWAYEHDLA